MNDSGPGPKGGEHPVGFFDRPLSSQSNYGYIAPTYEHTVLCPTVCQTDSNGSWTLVALLLVLHRLLSPCTSPTKDVLELSRSALRESGACGGAILLCLCSAQSFHSEHSYGLLDEVLLTASRSANPLATARAGWELQPCTPI